MDAYWNHPATFANLGYDHLDELVGGILQLEEPSPEVASQESEMVAYQPTPGAPHFRFHQSGSTNRARLTNRSGRRARSRGVDHVDLLQSARTGIELEPSYVESASKSARSLKLNNASFIQGDVRRAALAEGTVFYLYTTFLGTILRDVLDSLRQEAACRKIRLATFGPCTRIVAAEHWLNINGPLIADRIALFDSRA